MDMGPKDIARIIGVVIVVAIFAYLYLDKRNRLQRKLDGRDRAAVFARQAETMKTHVGFMGEIMAQYLGLFKNGAVLGVREVYDAMAPLYTKMEAAADDAEYIEELFDADILKLAGECQRYYNDFGFHSSYFDVMGFFDANPAVYENDKDASLYQAFMQPVDGARYIEFTPDKYAKLETLAADFENKSQKLLARLECQMSRQ